MNPLPHRSAAIRLGIVCTALLAASAVAARAEDLTKHFPVSGRANVRVETNDGSVRVTSGDSKQVEFHVEYQGYELGKTLHVDSHQDGDKVELTARVTGHWGFSFGHNSRHLHIEVRMPREGGLQVETGDGSVQVESISGTVNVHTGDGSVKANSLNGNIDLHTNDGGITVDGLKGDIRLRTGDGSIEARNLDGKVEADTGDGHIRIAGRFDALNVKTGDGSVDTRVQPGSKMASSWTIRTGDGSVDLVLPPDFQTNIDASTGDGHISLGIPVTMEGTFSNSQVHGKMNGGGPPLTIHTGDGSIRLSKS
jgi:opacity protein-like surface antigen